MIQFLSVSKNYGSEITALQDISFEIQEGEFVFLVGPSGSGKTTLIRMLIREELPTEGKIFFHDSDITRFKRNQVYQLRRKIGVIFQDFKLIPELNAYENIAFAMQVAGRSDHEIKENVPYLMDIVGLSKRMHFFPKQLSGGEQQRVAIARAIANNPKLLIADEPTGNLDPESAWDIVQILSKINNWGTTVIMSTHGSDIVNTLHKRVIKMEHGKMIRDVMKGTYDEVDDFSIKVMTSNLDDSQNNQKPTDEQTTPEEIVEQQIFAEQQSDADPEQETSAKSDIPLASIAQTDEQKPVNKPKKLKQISFNKEKKKAKKEQEQSLEEKVLAAFENDETANQVGQTLDNKADNTKKTSTDISSLDLNVKQRELLVSAGYSDLSKFKTLNNKKLNKIDGLSKKDIEKITRIIKTLA